MLSELFNAKRDRHIIDDPEKCKEKEKANRKNETKQLDEKKTNQRGSLIKEGSDSDLKLELLLFVFD
uniref:Uncharacterized protein n=1 Tax=Romanomermis culicivorax TaxID=13658 RepID=A0A915I6Q4_ROMCU